MTIKIELNQDAIKKLNEATKSALSLTAEAILSDVRGRQVVPFDKGIMQNDKSFTLSEIQNLVASVVFDTPYARRWYFNTENVNFQKTQNPYAQDHWMDYYLSGEGLDFVIESFSKFLKQESGGLIT